MPSCLLPDRGVVRVRGPDARDFLHNLLTNSMESLHAGEARYAALLTPQGKIIVDGFVTEADDAYGGGFYIDCPLALSADLAKRLGFYKLRAKIEIADLSLTLTVVGFWGDATAGDEDGIAYHDPRLASLGSRLIVEKDHAERLSDARFEAYHAHRIGLGVPEGGKDFAYADAFPHEADMDQLGGIDFTKGCYIGQEVVSRMQHRGTLRTRAVPVRFEKGVCALSGAEVIAGGKSAGVIGSVTDGGHAIALLRLDRIADAVAAGEDIAADGHRLQLERVDWMRFDVPVQPLREGKP